MYIIVPDSLKQFYTVIFLLLFCAHVVTAASKSNVSKLGHSDDKRMSMSRVVVLRRFLVFSIHG